MQGIRKNAVSIAFCIAGCALLLLVQRLFPEPYSGVLSSFVFLGMIVVAGTVGGWKSGLVATTLGLTTALFLFSPNYLSRIGKPVELVRLLSFTCLGLSLSAVSGLLNQAWKRVDDRQKQLAAAHEFLHSSLNALSTRIGVIDEHGTILEVNDAWTRSDDGKLGVGSKSLVGANYLKLCEEYPVPELATAAVNGVREILNGKSTYFQLEYHTGESASPRWFVLRATPFKSLGPIRVVVAHEEVTQIKVAEQRLREADRRKDEFLATLAHELRNPLAPIRNGLQIMKLEQGKADSVEQVRQMMERQVNQMLHLVDDLLDVSRISRGKIELRKQHVELATVIQQAIETSRPIIDAQQHQLNVTLPAQPILLDADMTRLAQVFSNLLNNAAKYSERGGRIGVTAATDGKWVRISVSDSGIGIPAHVLPQLFELFFQVNSSEEKSRSGLGIGLSLAKRLVEMHGGTIQVASAGIGKGSTFTVSLPIAFPEGAKPRVESPSAEYTAIRRVLVVDDNQDAVDSLARMLTLMGHQIETANDGFAALEKAEQFKPDFIVLDIGMPKMDGYETARQIRKRSWGNEVYLIALTGWGQTEDRRKSQEAGINLHLVKPIEPKTIERILRNDPQKSLV